MRTAWPWLVLLIAGAAGSQTAADPERILADRFQFSSREVEQARQGQAAVKVQADRESLAVVGAVRLPGRKERLADWLRNVEHFRGAAELGVAHVIPAPPVAAAFAGVTLDASDLTALQQCSAAKCALRLSSDALARVQRDVAWGSAGAAAQANEIVRQMLLGYTTAYQKGGNAGIAAYDGPQARGSYADDMQQLVRQATTVSALTPEFVAFLDTYPASTLAPVDQLFYWSATAAGSNTIVSLHHLAVYRRSASEIWIADKNLYASRYIDAGAMAIGLYDAPDGTGFYAIAGSRSKISQLGGVAGTVLRRQIERSAADTVRMYLEWIRESLAAGL